MMNARTLHEGRPEFGNEKLVLITNYLLGAAIFAEPLVEED